MTERWDVVVVGLGALGSATCLEVARRGRRVLGVERFELGHSRGASHDSSRILRHSYHTPAYVRLTQEAYADWARLERDTGAELVAKVGGLDLFPPDPAIPLVDYTSSLDDARVHYRLLDDRDVRARWPQFDLPPGTVALHQADAAIVPAARGTRVMQDEARRRGAQLRDSTPVIAVQDRGAAGMLVETGTGDVECTSVVLCLDAWVNDLLGDLGVEVPIDVTLEQVSYFRPGSPDRFAPGRLPLWIWMDDPSYYGFPCYGEPTVKAAQDCGGPSVDPESRTSEADPVMLDRLTRFMHALLPDVGPPVRSVRCQYTLTPDRDFVVSPVPGHPSVVVGLGAAHGFKFAPTLGRLLADLAVDGGTASDVSAFRLDRPALTDPSYDAHWLV